MYKKNILNKLLIIFILLAFIPCNIVHAENIKDLKSLNLDLSSISLDESNYGLPSKILVTPINLRSKKGINIDEWIKGVFYYSVEKLGFQDIPYHYLVTEKGSVYKANSSGDEKKISIDKLGDSNIVIGYLNTSDNDYISLDANESLKNLLITESNKNSINPDSVYISGTKFIKEKATNTITIEKSDLLGNWNSSFNKILDQVKDKYSPIAKEYKIDVENVTNPSEEVNPGDEVSISIKLKNSGEFGFYQNSGSEIVLTKEGENSSNFYINNQWLSQSQTGIMVEGQSLLPSKEKTFEFKVKAPLSIGEYSEKFMLKTTNGASIKINNPIELKIKLKKTDKQIIEIKNSAAGFVNVRKDSNNATVIRKVTAGERFFLLDLNQDTLWAKIDLGDGEIGYIAAWQFSYI